MAEIRVRPADLETDRSVLVELLLRYLTARSTDRRFRWLYQENPHGSARAWIATHGNNDEIVGSGAIVPRLVHVAGDPRLTAVMADFWIRPDFRTLGPALKLQKACVEGAAASGFAFFDLPQGNMAAVYRRMKLLGTKQLSMLAKPLRSEPYLRKWVSQPGLTRPLARIGDLLLQLKDWRGTGSYDIRVHQGGFGEEFSELFRRVAGDYGICVARSAEYLEWRYRNHYYLTYEIFTARRGARLVAYAAIVDSGDSAEVVDLFGESHPEVRLQLLREIGGVLRERGRSVLRIALHASSSWIDVLAAVGFKVRQTKPLVIHPFHTADMELPEWFLNYGDIDY